MKTHPRGFTLIEISIVIIVIALIIGGVVAGQGVLDQSRLAKVMSEYSTITRGIGQFKDKYNGLPGDLFNASNVLPTGGLSNGDGNGKIADQATWATYCYETHRAWQQLGLAGFMEGSYNGGFETASRDSTTAGAVVVTPGTRIPKTVYRRGTGWHLYHVGNVATSTFFSGNYGHMLYLGKGAYKVSAANKGTMKSQDMMALDTKFDDGLPFNGNIRSGVAGSIWGGTCVSGTAYAASQYTCIPIFITGF